MLFDQWSPPEPAAVVDLRDPAAMTWLLDRYGARNPGVLRTVLGHAYELGANGAVLEYRYIDLDWRSEHAHLYAGTFRRYPSVTHRLHFFTEPVPAEALVGPGPAQFTELGYLGYVVLRPVPAAPVGRVVLKPLEADQGAITCQGRDEVNLLGEDLAVTGSAFMAQDAMLLRCAHATLWMAAYHHYRAWEGRRVLPADVTAATPGLGLGRSVPSTGLDVYQMSAASEALGLPPLMYKLDSLPRGETMQRVACRYLNSGLPVIAVGSGHAWMLVGYRREDVGGEERIVFFKHDDEEGPYRPVPDFAVDDYAPWEYLMVPLPAKVYMPGEEAEAIARKWLQASLRDDDSEQSRALLAKLEGGQVALRSSVHRSNDVKSAVSSRGVDEPVASIYRRAQMSRWVWVVEVVDRDLRRAKKPCVVAEVVLDATDHPRDMQPLLVRTPTAVRLWAVDGDTWRLQANLPAQPAWASASRQAT